MNKAMTSSNPFWRRGRAVTQLALAVTAVAALGACGTSNTLNAKGTAAAPAAQPSTSSTSSGSPGSPASPASWSEPIRFVCNDTAPFTVVAQFSRPDPSSMTLRRGNGSVELQRQPTASGVRYAGANMEFWEHQGDVQLRWGPNAAPLRCMRQR